MFCGEEIMKLFSLTPLFVFALTGCEGARLKALDSTMLSVSDAVHEQRMSQLMNLLSKSTSNLLRDNLRALRKAYTLTGNLPEPLKTQWRESLPKAAVSDTEDTTAFLEELVAPVR